MLRPWYSCNRVPHAQAPIIVHAPVPRVPPGYCPRKRGRRFCGCQTSMHKKAFGRPCFAPVPCVLIDTAQLETDMMCLGHSTFVIPPYGTLLPSEFCLCYIQHPVSVQLSPANLTLTNFAKTLYCLLLKIASPNTKSSGVVILMFS